MDKPAATAPLRMLCDVLEHGGSKEDRATVAEILKSEVFVFDRESFPDGMFQASFDYGNDLLRFGLLHLPFQRVVFQIAMEDDGPPDADNDGFHHAIMIASEEDGGFKLRLYYHLPSRRSISGGRFSCFMAKDVAVNREELPNRASAFFPDLSPRRGMSAACATDEIDFSVGWKLSTVFVLGVLGLLAAKGVEVSRYEGPKALNAKRVAKGKPPIFSFHWVTIDPSALRVPGSSSGGHAAPRLHLRRGHIRRLASGSLTNVRPCLVGDPDRGVVEKAYRVKAGSRPGVDHADSR